MSGPILFLQHDVHDGPGLFAEAVAAAGRELVAVHAYAGERVPQEVGWFSGVVVGGGAMGAYEMGAYPFLAEEMGLIRNALGEGVPVLGMCLGAQMMAAALGGRAYPHTAKEIGFFEIAFAPEAEKDPLWAGWTVPFWPMQWHGDTFDLPHGGVLLASSAITRNQLFRVGERSYGFQFHLEADMELLELFVREEGGYLAANGVDRERFLAEARVRFPEVRPVAAAIFGRWIGML